MLYSAATEGKDPKVALDLLKHTRGWVAKQHVEVEVNDKISVLKALEMANARVDALQEFRDSPLTIEGTAIAEHQV